MSINSAVCDGKHRTQGELVIGGVAKLVDICSDSRGSGCQYYKQFADKLLCCYSPKDNLQEQHRAIVGGAGWSYKVKPVAGKGWGS